jgi:hypothetical protein
MQKGMFPPQRSWGAEFPDLARDVVAGQGLFSDVSAHWFPFVSWRLPTSLAASRCGIFD